MPKKFILYEKARETNKLIQKFIKQIKINSFKSSQLNRASTSFVLNIAEGNGRFSKADRKHFFIIARGSVHECVAIFDMLKDEQVISKQISTHYKNKLIELIKILTTLVNSLK